MASQYIITPISENGKQAIKTKIMESMQERRDTKLMFKMLGLRLSMVDNNAIIEITNRRLRSVIREDDIKRRIEEILREACAEPNIDYKIEVV